MTEQQRELVKWLNRAFHAEKKLNALKRLKKRDKERAKDISPKHNGDIKGKSDTRQNNVEKVLITLASSEEKYDKFLEEYNNLRIEIEKVIETLHDDELEAIFIYRYLDYMTMEQIAETMHYDVSTISRKHKKGLKKLQGNAMDCKAIM